MSKEEKAFLFFQVELPSGGSFNENRPDSSQRGLAGALKSSLPVPSAFVHILEIFVTRSRGLAFFFFLLLPNELSGVKWLAVCLLLLN